MGDQAEARRREATRAFVTYFLIGFAVVIAMSGITIYGIMNKNAVRIEYCVELEKLKTQNREDVFRSQKDFPRTLRLLNITAPDRVKEAQAVAQEGWDRKLARNAPKDCPYGG